MIIAIALALNPSPASASPDLAVFVDRTLHLTDYAVASVDLNGDGRPDALVYDRSDCGSGGCDLYVIVRDGASYRLVTRMSVVKPPVGLLARASHGWRDLGVTVCGGGIVRCYQARLRFDGHGYPENPTVPPALRQRRTTGTVLIAR